MTDAELRAKFDENAEEFLTAAQRDRLAEMIRRLADLPDAAVLVPMAMKQPENR